MSKLVTLLFTLVAFIAHSQTVVPNAGLEAWTDFILYEEPDGWHTPNPVTAFVGIELVTKSTDANSGLYAARLEGDFVSALGGNAPGNMSTGILDIVNLTYTGGVPLTLPEPAAMIGYYKYTPVATDSCLFYSILTKWNTTNGVRDTVAISVFIGGTTANYTLFSSPFITLMPGIIPDTQLIIISTAADVLSAQDGSVLYVDDIDFTGAIGIDEVETETLHVFPNPVDQAFEVTMPAQLKARSVIVSNITGKHYRQYELADENLTINTSSFSEGTYVIYAKDEKGRTVAEGKFIVKH